MHALWVVLATPGLRLGEALGLQWSDVDSTQGKVVIRRALQRQRGIGLVLVEPKTDRSRRTVYLAPGTIASLAEHRRVQARERLKAGPSWDATQALVFATRDGRPIEGGQVSWAFHKALKRAGLP